MAKKRNQRIAEEERTCYRGRFREKSMTLAFDPRCAVIIHFSLYPRMSRQREASVWANAIAYSAFMTFLCINICLDILFIPKEEGIGKQSFLKSKIWIPHVLMCSNSCVIVCSPDYSPFLNNTLTVESKYSLVVFNISLKFHWPKNKHLSFLPPKKNFFFFFSQKPLLYESTTESRNCGSPQPLNSDQVRLNLKQPQFWPY